jgi:hypothetical protein
MFMIHFDKHYGNTQLLSSHAAPLPLSKPFARSQT